MSDLSDLSAKVTDLCKDHPLNPEARMLVSVIKVSIEQWQRLDAESRSHLRDHIVRDIDRLAELIQKHGR